MEHLKSWRSWMTAIAVFTLIVIVYSRTGTTSAATDIDADLADLRSQSSSLGLESDAHKQHYEETETERHKVRCQIVGKLFASCYGIGNKRCDELQSALDFYEATYKVDSQKGCADFRQG